MERRYRLSRSRDFDAVYRQGRSVSTRYLTLHWFPREDDPEGVPRLGLAVPKSVGSAVTRNRIKRQLRETWRDLGPATHAPGTTTSWSRVPVLRSRRSRRGREWLVEQVADVLGQGGSVIGPPSIGVAAVWAWRHTLGVLTPAGTCKYHPSCSQYAIDAFRQHGLLRGAVLAGWRLLRCNPWSHGGVDHVPDQTLFRRSRR